MENFSANPLNEENNAEELESIENDREFKAHIYQHLVDLQPFLAPDSQVAVLVQPDEERDEDDDEDSIGLTLVATVGEYRIESEGRDSDIYEAFGIAKRKMMEQLEEWYNAAVDTTERDEQIQSMLSGDRLLH